jgi:hypothetical protein
MAGTKGRSGRRPGSLSWPRNPVALAGNHLNVLIEMWLGGALIKIQNDPERWLVPPTERRFTVPPNVMQLLARFAIEHVLAVNTGLKRPADDQSFVDQVLLWARRRAPPITLRRKAGLISDEREVAYQAYLDDLTNSWKGDQSF